MPSLWRPYPVGRNQGSKLGRTVRAALWTSDRRDSMIEVMLRMGFIGLIVVVDTIVSLWILDMIERELKGDAQ